MPSSRCSRSSFCSSISRKADSVYGITLENHATHSRHGQAYTVNGSKVRLRKYLKSVIQEQHYEKSQQSCDVQKAILPNPLPLSPCASSDSGVDFSYDSASVKTCKSFIDRNILFDLSLGSCHVQEVCNSGNMQRDAGEDDCLICLNEPCYTVSVDFDEPMSIIIEDSLQSYSLGKENEVCEGINVSSGFLDPNTLDLSRSIDLLECHASSGLLDFHALDTKNGKEVPSYASGGTSVSLQAGISYAQNDHNPETIDFGVARCDLSKICEFPGKSSCLDRALGMQEPVVAGQMLYHVQPTCATVDSILAANAHVVDEDSTPRHLETVCANSYCTDSPVKHVPLFGTCNICNSDEGDLGAMFLSDLKINSLVNEFENQLTAAASSLRNTILSPVSCMEVEGCKICTKHVLRSLETRRQNGQPSLNSARTLQRKCDSLSTSIYSGHILKNDFLLPAWSPLPQSCSLSKTESQQEILGKDQSKEYLYSDNGGLNGNGSHSSEAQVPALQTGVMCSGNVTLIDSSKFDFVSIEGSNLERLSAEPSFTVVCNVPLETTTTFGCLAPNAGVLQDNLQFARPTSKECGKSSVRHGSFCSTIQTFVESASLCAGRTCMVPCVDIASTSSTSVERKEPREGFNDDQGCRLLCSTFDSSSADLDCIQTTAFHSGEAPEISKSVDIYGNFLVPEVSQASCGKSARSTPLPAAHANAKESAVDELARASSRKTLAAFCRHLSRKSSNPLVAKQSGIVVESAALSKEKISLCESASSCCSTRERPSHASLTAISSRKTLAAFFRHLSSKSLDSSSGEQSGMGIENTVPNKVARTMGSWQNTSSSYATRQNRGCDSAEDLVAPLPSPCETIYPVTPEWTDHNLSNKLALQSDLSSANSFEMVVKRTERQYGLGCLRRRSSSLMHDFEQGLFPGSKLVSVSDEQLS